MSTYYGGRSEVHIRRQAVQVLYCDFLSMYPTVCTLMGLWRFVTANGMDWQDSTQETFVLLQSITLAGLKDPETWKLMCTLVKVSPQEDIFPIRTNYGNKSQYSIGLNHLKSRIPLWYTLVEGSSKNKGQSNKSILSGLINRHFLIYK